MSTSPTLFCSTCGARFSNEVRFCPQDGEPLELLPADTRVDVDPLVGTVIDGRYRVDSVLGEGGMGIVYQVMHVSLNKPMALKLLRGEMARDEIVVKRFMQEAQAATTIGHANIIDIHDFGALPSGDAYFVMEFLEGESLTDLITRGRLSVAEVIPIVEQIASALSAAHQRGVIHRDLKPDNVQLIRRGADERFVKVLDFGVAKVGGASSKLTRTGMVFGTPHYISPEQASGQSVDPRTDIYALGVILYEMCTGQVPFDGDTFMGILSKHMFEVPKRPTEIHLDSGPLEPIVLRALSKRPEDRYESMEALIADLATLRDGGEVTMPMSSAVVSPPVGFGPTVDEQALQVPTKTPLVALGILGGLLVLGAIAGAWFALSGRTSQVRTAAATPVVTVAEPEPDSPEPLELPTAELPPEMVRIESDPTGAAVLIEDAVIGNTPLEVRRPVADDQQLIEVRMRGHESRTISLTAASGEMISLSLEPERSVMSVSTARMTVRPVSPMVSTMVQTMSVATPAMTPVSPTFMSEVVDPWAD